MMARLSVWAAILAFISFSGFLVFEIGKATEYSYRFEKQIAQESKGGAETPRRKESFWQRATDDPVAIFTLALVVFTLVLAISTVGLWWTTRNLGVAGERALKTTERAFVHIDGFNFEMTTGADRPLTIDKIPTRYQDDPGLYLTRFAIQPRWKNSGRTPTRGLFIQVDWRAPGSPIPIDYRYRRAVSPLFLAPEAVQTGEVIDVTGGQALIAWAGNPVGEEPLMVVWGRADYQDVFGNDHFNEWCYKVRFSRPRRSEPMRAELIQWGDHNRSDDG